MFMRRLPAFPLPGLALLAIGAAGARPPDGGGAVDGAQFSDELPLARRGFIEQTLRATQARLRAAGTLAPASVAAVSLQWPLQPTPSYPWFGYYGISNFVDHDGAFPDKLLDYNCGTRTYDTAQGYNHAGTDYFLWPAPWRTMDNEQVAVVAAAAGTIIGRSDLNYDRSCAMGDAPWNAVYLRHADGSVTWYGHLKAGTVTSKNVGDSVDAGEYLGFVGSSGSSTGPHLHFELHDGSGHVVDPRHGACNAGPEYWAVAQPYTDPRINSLSVLDDEPYVPDCGVVDGEPREEILHDTGALEAGQTFFAMATYRDHSRGEITQLRIRRPDGSVFAQWSFDLAGSGLPRQFYSATYWYWRYVLPADAPQGDWKFEADYQGNSYASTFVVLDVGGTRDARVQRERENAAQVLHVRR
jgi:murein DD-endopeptidase MepM/ murein hydrolase activator NlpD